MKALAFAFRLVRVLIFFLSAATTACAHERPRVIAGVLDLSHWNFETDGPIDLSGDYEFYWQELLPPDSFRTTVTPNKTGFMPMPRSWNGYHLNGLVLPGTGFATYRVTILLPPDSHSLALKLLDMGTAYKVFANGELILAVGETGVTAGTSKPCYLPQVVDLPPAAGQLELIYHVSNFHHRRGGAWEVIRMGASDQVYRLRERRLAFDLTLFGSIFVMGLYHLAFFVLRRRDASPIFFGFFCLLIAVRMLCTVERNLMQLFPTIPWQTFVKVEYLSVYFAMPVFIFFLRSLFEQEVSRRVAVGITVVYAILSAIVLTTPVAIFSYTGLFFEFFVVLSSLYVCYVLMRALQRRREGAIIFLLGFVVLFAAVVNDVLDVNEIIQTGHFVQLGLLVFIFSQAFMLSFRYSRAFLTIDMQRADLEKANENYKRELQERQRTEQENRELQERLERSQKMEALGLLAGGVAHDLNNILSGIVTYPDLLLMDLPKRSRLKEPLETIRNAGLRAATVVQDLLTLARRGILHLEPVNLNEVICEYLRSPEHAKLMSEHPNVRVSENLDSGLLNVKGSAYHLRKAIMNLVANALEAQAGGGIIALSTANRYVDSRIKGYEEITEGNYAVFRIEDQGVGIAADDLKKIFEPFYTKKVMGRSGSGLGMSVVWGVVHDHNGFIDLQSRADEGSIFEVYFNVTTEECTRETSSIPIESYLGRNEHILIVDDISEQREIASRILTRLGYRVSSVTSGKLAVEFIKNNPVDLVVLDMIMDPGIDGLETYQQIVAIRPGTRAIVASGYSETDRVKETQKLGAGRYIKKPYTLEKIGLAVR
ncbi:MAG TPA: 7TM diverse intracellular signaling domain-containing protein, partial [bacterium]